MTQEQTNGMIALIVIILLGVVAGALLPSLLLWQRHIQDFFRRRRAMYNAYLSRLDDFEQYSRFMERCERDHQIKKLLNIQEQARKMWGELKR